MIDDHDVFTAARLLIDKHGDGAALMASQRAEQMLDQGDLDGAMVWRQILEGIDELQRERAPGEALN